MDEKNWIELNWIELFLAQKTSVKQEELYRTSYICSALYGSFIYGYKYCDLCIRTCCISPHATTKSAVVNLEFKNEITSKQNYLMAMKKIDLWENSETISNFVFFPFSMFLKNFTLNNCYVELRKYLFQGGGGTSQKSWNHILPFSQGSCPSYDTTWEEAIRGCTIKGHNFFISINAM